MDFCMNCGKELPPEAGFCPKCGTKVDIPACPSCGKEIDPADDFCLYCGARLREEEPAPEAEVGAPQPMAEEEDAPPEEDVSKPVENHGPQPENESAPKRWRNFSWTYRRLLILRWRQRVDVNVEVDDQRLRCTDIRTLRDPAVIEEEMPLADIEKMTIVGRSSFLCWMLSALAIATLVVLPMLPLFGVQLVIGIGELAGVLLGVGAFFALLIWLMRFNLYHHRMVITSAGSSEPREIVLEALKAEPLQTLQKELTRQTGVQLPAQSEGSDEIKAVFGAIIGVCLAVALIFVAVDQGPNTSPASLTEADRTFFDTTQSTAQPTPKPTPTPEPTPTPTPTQEPASYYYVDELLGYWEDTVYDVPGPSSLSFEEDGSGEIMVTFTMWMSDSLSGLLQVDDEGDIYVDMVSMFSETGEPSYRLYLFYDGYGIMAYTADSANEEPYYFVR